MEKREVPTSEYEPEDVPQRRSEAFACLRDDGAAERPDAEQGDSQRSNAERDRHDEDEAEHSGECVSDEQPEAGKHEPEDVPEQSHVASLTPVRPPGYGSVRLSYSYAQTAGAVSEPRSRPTAVCAHLHTPCGSTSAGSLSSVATARVSSIYARTRPVRAAPLPVKRAPRRVRTDALICA